MRVNTKRLRPSSERKTNGTRSYFGPKWVSEVAKEGMSGTDFGSQNTPSLSEGEWGAVGGENMAARGSSPVGGGGGVGRVVFLSMIKSTGGEGFEVEDNEFLFVLCAGKAVWVGGKSLWLC